MIDLQNISPQEIMDTWGCPNTYNNNFAIPDPVGGVYVIFGYKLPMGVLQSLECVYVGASNNLYKRYVRHPVRSNPDFWWCGFYWKQFEAPFDVEKLLIKQLKPLLNKQHNG